MYDIITFGSAAQDIHIKSKAFKILKDLPAQAGENNFTKGEGLCLALGSKIDVEDIKFASGGGGTNTAVAFAKQGFKTAFCGTVGEDNAGKEIIEELKKLRVNTGLTFKIKEKPTNHSIIIESPGQDRIILVYRGASELLTSKEIPWNKLKTKWIYLAPLSGLLCDNFEDIVDFAFNNKIKVAANPGNSQLSLPQEKLKNILKKINVLILNKEEASQLTKIPFAEEQSIFKKIDEICSGVFVMTKGGEGVVVSDGKYLYRAKPHKNRKVVDTTGAGDSFASGFISDYIRRDGDIEKAIQLGMANSEENLAKTGAKTGLLEKNSEFERVQVTKEERGQNNLCISKF
ncbi:MAG: carbohydrate kinase family protein [Patescibacteria group bacterium]